LLPGVATGHANARHAEPEFASNTGRTIRAPDVASVIEVLLAQCEVEVGTVICRLEVPGETVEVASPRSGVVGALFAAAGAFVEYHSPLVTIISSK
jgi:biotin carboxyl carrier protein